MRCHKKDLWPGNLLSPDAPDEKLWGHLMALRICSDMGQVLWRSLSVLHDPLRKQTSSGQEGLGLKSPKLLSLGP